ncbi:MAG TPA: ABC transporter ATP-binding protein [Acidimicrobiia bacterium]|nr:ABC transporter ATP-binding protein [Acidimicrobiia bacterium]
MKTLVTEPAKLEISGLTVRFGGLVAVDGVSLEAAPGTITGLIGPNGAGKTTIFNACTGFVPVLEGTVRLDGRRLDGASSAQRANLGLGRTFQRMQLFDTMTVVENVALGLEARLAGLHWWRQAGATRREQAICRGTAEQALARCGISHLAGVTVGYLPAGQRRLVEMARAIAGRFRFLLLDEPSSGLDEAESDNFGRILTGVALDDGIGILLVEHDVPLVRRVCSSIYVLDFGRLIYQGPTADVMASEVVRAAYLGSAELEGAV